MARPKGSRDKGYAERRRQLLAAARDFLAEPAGRRASWREVAAACGVSVPTLNHYFPDRSALVSGILEEARGEGDRYLVMAATPAGPFADSIRQLVGLISIGLSHGVLALQVIGIGEGFADEASGTAYLTRHLDPMLAAIAERLDVHVAAGEMRAVETRFAAIALLSPLLVAHLHQDALPGRTTHPMSLDAHASAWVESFVRAYVADTDGA